LGPAIREADITAVFADVVPQVKLSANDLSVPQID
jgi:hypothetical protein